MSVEAEISVEAVGRRRRKLVSAVLVIWTIWWAILIVADFTHSSRSLPPIFEGTLLLVQVVSYVLFVICLFRFHSLNKDLRRHPVLATTLNDELAQQVWLQALKVGFGCTLGFQFLLVSAATLHLLPHPFSAAVGAEITILVASASSMGTYLWMERE